MAIRYSETVRHDQLDEVKAATADGGKYLPPWPVTVRDGDGNTVAEVSKTLYVRRKRA